MYLIFDTETTGFPFKQCDACHPAQARVLQLTAIRLDSSLTEIGCLSTLIKLPQDKKIDEGAFAQHGKTWEMCNERGRDIESVYTEFSGLLLDAKYLIAHNIKFDLQMMNIEGERLYLTKQFINDIDPICTMELMTPICKLPHLRRNSFGQSYKWPKLKEAYKFIFGVEPENQHDSLGDVRATIKIFKWLVSEGHVKLDKTCAV